jgi:hypothetical protein
MTIFRQDVFRQLANLYNTHSEAALIVQCLEFQAKALNVLQTGALLIAVDEAQVPASTLVDVFSASTGTPEHKRPLLKEVIASLLSISRHLVISGTGLSMKDVTELFSSAIAKHGDRPVEVYTDVGAFDDAESQWGYASQYLPTKGNTSLWVYLSQYLHGPGTAHSTFPDSVRARMAYWLRGRWVFTGPFKASISLYVAAIGLRRRTFSSSSRTAYEALIEY